MTTKHIITDENHLVNESTGSAISVSTACHIEGVGHIDSSTKYNINDIDIPNKTLKLDTTVDKTAEFTTGVKIYVQNYPGGGTEFELTELTVASSSWDATYTQVIVNEDCQDISDNSNWIVYLNDGSLPFGYASHIEGEFCFAIGESSHAEGANTIASGYDSHAEGSGTIASGPSSHAEGSQTIAGGQSSHAEGANTTADSDSAHAEGSGTIASGPSSHAEGSQTIAGGQSSHAEGANTIASGYDSHAEGSGTIASGYFSHAEGDTTTAVDNCHAEGSGANAYLVGMHAKKSFKDGYGQYCNITLYRQTTNDTKYPLWVGSTGKIIIPNNTIYNFRVLGIGADGSGNSATYNITGVAKNIGGTVTVANIVVTELSDDFTITGMSAEADDTNNALVITATGKAATTIKWSAFVEWQEITFV